MKTFTKHILLLALMLFGALGASAKVYTTLQVGDVIHVGDQFNPGEYSRIVFDGWSYNCNPGQNTPLTLVRANLDPYLEPGQEVNVTESETGDYYVFKIGNNNYYYTEEVRISTTENSDGLVVTSASVQYNAPYIVFAVHEFDPTVPALDQLTGNWNFLMPGSNKVVKVTYKAEPALAWTFGNRAIPNDTTITAYRGFELPVIGSIGAIMDHDFLTALLGGTVSLRYGSTNPAVISFTNPNDMWSVSVNGAGECNVYMVFDGNDDFQDDSVAFHAVIANPATLTLAAQGYGMGTVSALLGSESDGNDLLGTFTGNSTTIDGIATLNPNGAEYDEQTGWGIYTNNTDMTVTIAEGVNVTKVKFIGDFGSYYEDTEAPYQVTLYQYYDGFTNSANGESVASIEVYGYAAGSDSIVATATEGQYLVIPGATVTVVATAVDGAHVSAWSPINKAVTNLLSDTATFTVGETMTLTATFVQNPVLTLASNNSEWGTVTLDGVTPGATTYNITISENPYPDVTYTNVSFPFHTTVFLHEGLDGVEAGEQTPLIVDQVGDNADITINGPYGGTIEYSYNNHEGAGVKAIFCEAVEGLPIMPEGVTYAGYDTYLVLPGTEVKVIATPDSAHYLKNFVGGADTNSNVAVNNTFTVTADTTLTANFQAKPTLTLDPSAGGTLEAIVPQGGVTAMHLTTDQISTWDGVYENAMEADLQPFGFVAVDSAAAAAWTGVPASGEIHLLYAPAGNKFKAHVFRNGQWSEANTAGYPKDNIYEYSDIVYFTTGVSKSNVIASTTEPNTYIIDYGTEVTVKATPDSIHYLATLGEELVNSNDSIHRTFTMTAPVNLPADFRAKPTLTLAHNDGGEMEIVPALDVTAMHLTTDQIPTWDGDINPTMEADLQPFGFVAVDSAAAAAWTGAPASGVVNLIYAPAGSDMFKVHLFQNGQWSEAYNAYYPKGNIYEYSDIVYFTTGTTSNVTATAEPNTYYIDYNTSVTVKAMPSDTTYLVRFDNDADTNSNTAVEKTYGPLTAALTTAEATFNDKPVLTLAANDTTWGKVMLEGAGSGSSNGYTIKFSANGNTIVKENVTLPKTYQCEYGSPSEFDNIIRELYGWTGAHGNENAIPTVTGTDAITPGIESSSKYPEFTINSAFQGTATVTIGYTNSSWVSDNWPIEISFVPALPAGVAQIDSVTYRVDYGTTVTVQAEATELHHVANRGLSRRQHRLRQLLHHTA